MIFDLHNDLLTGTPGEGSIVGYIENNIRFMDNVVLAYWTTKTHLSMLSVTNILNLFNNGYPNKKIHYAIEDLHFLKAQDIEPFMRLPILYASLTWNYENSMAGGALSAKRLTALGKKVIDAIHDTSIFLDVAHLNERSFYDVADYYQKPMLCSHTAFHTVNAHPRNLKDAQIERIIESNGLIGLSLVTAFLTNNRTSDSDDVVRHIDYFAQKYGVENLAIGTDFFGSNDAPTDMADYLSFLKLAEKLSDLGYPDSDIRRIFRENAQKFFGIPSGNP